jgi:uncharacterized membrane protein (DUF106 family)
MEKYKDNPKKIAEIQKNQLKELPENMKKMFLLSGRSIIWTGIPMVLFFKWFMDYFSSIEEGFKFFGFMNWFVFYLVFFMIFSSILRKKLNIA